MERAGNGAGESCDLPPRCCPPHFLPRLIELHAISIRNIEYLEMRMEILGPDVFGATARGVPFRQAQNEDQ